MFYEPPVNPLTNYRTAFFCTRYVAAFFFFALSLRESQIPSEIKKRTLSQNTRAKFQDRFRTKRRQHWGFGAENMRNLSSCLVIAQDRFFLALILLDIDLTQSILRRFVRNVFVRVP